MRRDAIEIWDAWGFETDVFPHIDALATSQGKSRSDVMREILYSYYNYTPSTSQSGDMYRDGAMWVLPATRYFADTVMPESVIRRTGQLSKRIRGFVTDPFTYKITGRVVVRSKRGKILM